MLRTFLMTFASVVVLCGAQGACSSRNGDCSIFASDYDQSCTQDSDCVAVFSGSFCRSGGNECACENAAINMSDQQRYDSDLQAENAPACPCPAAPPVACNHGACVVRPFAPPDGGTD